jgi:hypothetical protein
MKSDKSPPVGDEMKGIFSMDARYRFLVFGKVLPSVLLLSVWLCGCTAESELIVTPVPERQTIPGSSPINTPAASPYPTAKENGDRKPSNTPTLLQNGELPVQPAKDITPPPPDQLALADLAIHLGVPSSEIKILSHSSWTDAAPTCNLVQNDKQKLLLNGSHMQVTLSYKDRSYEYWVFQTGDAQFALPCQ